MMAVDPWVWLCLQAVVFEEVATMDFPFEGIPTVPPRKDTKHMVGGWVGRAASSTAQEATRTLWQASMHASKLLLLQAA